MGPGSCAGSLEIFDGKRRYDVTFADLPKQRLQQEAYAGEAGVCRAESRPVFGFKPGKRAPSSPAATITDNIVAAMPLSWGGRQ